MVYLEQVACLSILYRVDCGECVQKLNNLVPFSRFLLRSTSLSRTLHPLCRWHTTNSYEALCVLHSKTSGKGMNHTTGFCVSRKLHFRAQGEVNRHFWQTCNTAVGEMWPIIRLSYSFFSVLRLKKKHTTFPNAKCYVTFDAWHVSASDQINTSAKLWCASIKEIRLFFIWSLE